ncbi:MAG: HAD-superfamily hydrolase, subfamily variant 1 [Herbinix sp.]|jgi:putative hydrolase of the HAD superfamily|nr:HAD-superfamily hydrolase, subfamily variant 1 [Herbinix sp.]
MKLPKMIMFDYGQTLIAEGKFDGEAGIRAVLKYAKKNPYQISAKQLQEFAKTLNREIGRYDPDVRKSSHIEVHNHLFQNYLYQYFDIEIDLSAEEVEKVFWDSSADRKPTKNVELLLRFLSEKDIRTAVISNISFSGKALEERIGTLIPDHNFEFIIATSEYVFRKPHSRIFELALRKAKLDARDVWYCGDNAFFDVEGASKSGLCPVWYRGALDQENRIIPGMDCLAINDWMELIDYLKGNQ